MQSQSKSCRDALNLFDSTFPFERYNLFNCHNLPSLSDVERGLAVSLATYPDLDEPTRAAVRATVDSRLAAKLNAFALRMASGALRDVDDSYLLPGAVAMALDADVADARDVYLALAVLSDAAARLSSKFDDVIRRVSHCATPLRRG